jgi:Mlc titration factor MtfA (ptsG expression regulator)
MIFAWLRGRRRRKLLSTPFPAAWLEYLRRNVSHYEFLNEAERARLRDDLRILVAEKRWEGCGGLRMTDEIKVTIAAQAALLVLGIGHNYFERVRSILVYPRGYRAPGPDGEDVPGETHGRLGEAWYRGPVVLSWADALAGGRNQGGGQNLVFHEFAHQLDMLDGLIDGTPLLETPAEYRRWREVMTAEYERLTREAGEGRRTLLDPYGATNEGEFFAVATECFFEQPVALSRQHPKLYELLRDYYHQDPAARCHGKQNASRPV